jgi:putative efflux protein, MATE family
MEQTKFEKNLVKGSVVKQLLMFAIPFIISNVIQSLYSVADMIIVGQFAGTASMSGVNIGGQLIFILTNIIFGLCAGATVLIGQYLGSGERENLQQTVATLFTLLLIAAVVLSGIMLIFRHQALELILTPEESYSESLAYLTITALGTVFIFGYNAFSAVMRGMGDSKRPLIFVTIACVTNVFLDLLFVGVFHWDAAGAAIATVISQAVSMLLCIIYFKRNNFIFDFKLKSFRIHKTRFGVLMKIGIPTSVQNVVTSVSFMAITTMVNSFGVTASAAVGAVGKLNMFAILPAIAVSSSISAMSAQNIGAGEIDRAKKTMLTGMGLSFVMCTIIFVLVQLFPEQLLRVFSDDESLLAEGVLYLRYVSIDYLIAPIMFSFNGLFIGSGHTMFSLINSLMSSILIRVPAAYILGIALDMGIKGLGLGIPAATILTLSISIWYFLSGRWKSSKFVKYKIEVDIS